MIRIEVWGKSLSCYMADELPLKEHSIVSNKLSLYQWTRTVLRQPVLWDQLCRGLDVSDDGHPVPVDNFD